MTKEGMHKKVKGMNKRHFKGFIFMDGQLHDQLIL